MGSIAWFAANTLPVLLLSLLALGTLFIKEKVEQAAAAESRK